MRRDSTRAKARPFSKSTEAVSPANNRYIGRLSVEILSDILWLSNTSLSRLVQLSFICRHWYLVIQGSPRLWATIHCKDTLSLICRALKKSRKCPLILEGYWAPRITYCDERHCYRFIKNLPLMAINVKRWASVKIHVRRDELIDLPRPAPLLRSLELTSEKPRYHTGFIFCGQTPNLGSLSLKRLLLPLDSPLFNTLRSLHISENSIPISLYQLLTALRRIAGSLEDFHLSQLAIQADTDWYEHDLVDRTTLPHLTRLGLLEIPCSASDGLMAAIRTPACASLKLFLDGAAPNVLDDFFKSLLPSTTEGISKLEIEIKSESFEVNVFYHKTTDGRQLSIKVSHRDCLAMIVALGNFYRAAKPLESTIRFADGAILPDDLDLLTDTLPYLQNVIFGSVSAGVLSTFCNHICNPYNITDGVHQWYLPDLKRFKISKVPKNGSYMEELHRMILTRHFPNKRSRINLPVPLQRLELVVDAKGSVLWKEIRKLMGRRRSRITYKAGKAVEV